MTTTETHTGPQAARHRLALTAICIGFLMITLDATIVNVALPAIQDTIGVSRGALQWVADAYTVALAAVLLTAGTVADRRGARQVFLIGLVVFVVSSAMCALSTNMTVLIAARLLQGVGAAGLLPPSLTLIVHEFPDPSRRAQALGIWGGMSGIGLTVGPVLGGLAVATIGWRAIFLVNVPVGLATIVLTVRTVSETPRQPGASFDWTGQLLSIVALGTLAAGLIEVGQLGWSHPMVVTLLVTGLVAGAVFVLAEHRTEAPMLPLRVFSSHRFSIANGIGLLFNFCLYGSLLCIPLYPQQSRHQSALAAGLLLVPMTAIVGLNAFCGGKLTAKVGARIPMLLGASAGVVGAVLLAFLGDNTSLAWFFAGSVVFGFISLAMPSMTSVAMQALPASQAGMASGVLNAARQTGSALGIALLGSLLSTGGSAIHRPFVVVAIAFGVTALLALPATADVRRAGQSGRAPARHEYQES
ncbi:MFS transporter [Nocardia sp. NEAU-G5]|uniref:MFS transporter n=1 Tax=Nocardia albiluteola TaxID=2842303 RepID=A0ABS6B1U4_9NOCA|nr:MFS transporter [Nocardia albiluteola]MBU3064264.1 MFS transporter [Nocardia albiluteola]